METVQIPIDPCIVTNFPWTARYSRPTFGFFPPPVGGRGTNGLPYELTPPLLNKTVNVNHYVIDHRDIRRPTSFQNQLIHRFRI